MGYRKWRQVAEHRIARLMQLGVRQACYFGRVKTLGQLLLAAMVANLTLVATKMGLMWGRNEGKRAAILLCSQIRSLINEFWGKIWAAVAYCLALTLIRKTSGAGFRPGF